MHFRLPAAPLILALAACGGAPPRPLPPPPEPASDSLRAKDDEIVALHEGRPLTWRAVAERAMQTDLKSAVDQYVRGRIVEDRRAALGLVNSPAELRQRAAAVARRAREGMGEAAYRAELSGKGYTEEGYVDQLARSRLMDETLAIEKIVRYEEMRRGSLEIDWMIFADAKDADRFVGSCREKGFDAAADAFRGSDRVMRRPRESFPRGRPPGPPAAPVLDPAIVENLSRMKPGEVTGAQASLSKFHYVIKLAASRPPREASYEEVKEEVFESILRNAPAPSEIRGWVDAEFARARIEYKGR